jgi:hypothetical protein
MYWLLHVSAVACHHPPDYLKYKKYTTHPICISSNSGGPNKLPEDGRLLQKHVGASAQNKGVVQSVHIAGLF